MKHNSGVYEILNATNGKRYVGSSKHIYRRWVEHKKRLRRGAHENGRLQNAWNKYGESAFIFRPLLICAKANLIDYEQRCLDGLKPEYNILPNARSSIGRKYPPEYGAAISARLRGKKLGPHTAEHAAKISTALTGRTRPPFSPEWRAKLSAATKGVPLTEAHKLALSKARRGRPRSPLTEAHKLALSLSTKGRTWSAERRARFNAKKVAP